MLNVIRTSLLSIFLLVVFPKALFSVLYFSSCIPPHSALLSPHFLQTTTFMQMILNFFFSFHPRNFDSSISHLQTALQLIFSWMSANLLTLNSSKTEFLIIGLKQQLSKHRRNHVLKLGEDQSHYPLPSPFSLPFPSLPPFPLLFPSPSLYPTPPLLPSLFLPSLRSRPPKIQLGGLGERCISSRSGVWGGAPAAEIELCAF